MNNKNNFNAIRNRKTGNILVSHVIGGETIYFWVVMTKDGIISVENNYGYLLREKDWEYMSRRDRGIRTKYPVTDGILKRYYKALILSENSRIAKFKSSKRKSEELKNNSGGVILTVKTAKAEKTTFGDFADLSVLKEKMAS